MYSLRIWHWVVSTVICPNWLQWIFHELAMFFSTLLGMKSQWNTKNCWFYRYSDQILSFGSMDLVWLIALYRIFYRYTLLMLILSMFLSKFMYLLFIIADNSDCLLVLSDYPRSQTDLTDFWAFFIDYSIEARSHLHSWKSSLLAFSSIVIQSKHRFCLVSPKYWQLNQITFSCLLCE